MTTRAMGPLAGLGWLKRGINLGRHNARAVLGGAALLAVAAIMPSVLQLAVLKLFAPGPTGMLAVAAIATVLSIVILSPLIGGYLRLIHATEQNRPAHAADVLLPFKAGGDAGRLIGFGVLMTAVYLAVALVVVGLFGEGFLEWYVKVLSISQTQPTDASAIPDLPEGFGRMIGLGSLLALFVSGVYAIGFGQVALASRTIGGAIGDGVVGTAKNLLPLLLLAIVAFVLAIVLGVLLGLLMMLVVGIGSLVHPAVGMALVVPIYLGILLVMYVVMFGVMYHFWRDVCGEAVVPGNDDRVEA